jgi:hypothetical protein
MPVQERISSPAPPERATTPAVAASPAAVSLAPGLLSPAAVLLLQQSAGNAAVAALLRRGHAGGDGHACTCDDGTADEEMCESCRRKRPLRRAAESGSLHRQEAPEGGETPEGEEEEPVSLGTISIAPAEPVKVVVFAPGPTLKGETTAHYSSDTPTLVPNPPKASRAKGCKECGNESCIRAQGTMVVTYASNPTVELPDLDRYGFTDCQRKNAEKFVNNVLSPHEQEHVKTFIRLFDGTVKTPFDLKVCSTDDAAAKIDALYKAQLEARREKAQAASDALDAGGKNQFTWDMDEGCEKEEGEG